MNSIGLNDTDLFGMPTGGPGPTITVKLMTGERILNPLPPPPSCLTRFDTHANPAACCFSAGPKAVVRLA